MNYVPTLESLLARTRKDGTCLRWTGTIKKKTGLPQIGVNGQKVLVTRLIAQLSSGLVITPKDAVVHTEQCKHRDCIFPGHLLIVPRGDAWRYRRNELLEDS